MADRAALTGILFVLRTGIQWEMLPLEMGCGSGITCWRRLRDWQEAGVWDALHTGSCCVGCGRPTGSTGAGHAWTARPLRPEGGRQDRAERNRSRPARHETPSRHRPERIPLAFVLTGANTHDSMPFEDLLDRIPSIGGKTGRARRRPDKLHADKAYDHRRCR